MEEEEVVENGETGDTWWLRAKRWRIPSYIYVSLSIFVVLVTVGVIGAVYYARSVSTQNQQSAENIALER